MTLFKKLLLLILFLSVGVNAQLKQWQVVGLIDSLGAHRISLNGLSPTSNPTFNTVTATAIYTTGFYSSSSMNSMRFLYDYGDGSNYYFVIKKRTTDLLRIDSSGLTAKKFYGDGSGLTNIAIDSGKYATRSFVSSGYYPTTNPSGFITSSALSGYALQSTVDTIRNGRIGVVDNKVNGAISSIGSINSTIGALQGDIGDLQYDVNGINSSLGSFYLASNPSGFITSSALSGYATNTQINTLNTRIDSLIGVVAGLRTELSTRAKVYVSRDDPTSTETVHTGDVWVDWNDQSYNIYVNGSWQIVSTSQK